MRLLLALVVTMAWLGMAPAQKFDLNEVSCSQLVNTDKQTTTYLIVWLRGFWTEADEPMILDLERLEADAARVTEFCANNPGMKVFGAADKIFQ